MVTAALTVPAARWRDARFEIAAEGLNMKWQPSADDLKSCQELNGKIAEAVKA